MNESKEDRLKRLQDNSYVEAIETLLNSIGNYFNNELRRTAENYQTSLLFMGVHAAALTISEVFFNQTGSRGYKHFLKEFVDGEAEDKQFSLISDTIHDWRNILAHQWIGSLGHKVGYDYEMAYGWQERDGITFINPEIYCDQYLLAFKAQGRIWKYRSLFSEQELEGIKGRIIQRYLQR